MVQPMQPMAMAPQMAQPMAQPIAQQQSWLPSAGTPSADIRRVWNGEAVDWSCSVCGNRNYSGNHACSRCRVDRAWGAAPPGTAEPPRTKTCAVDEFLQALEQPVANGRDRRHPAEAGRDSRAGLDSRAGRDSRAERDNERRARGGRNRVPEA